LVLVRVNTKRILRIHIGLFLAEAICVSAFIVETRRALGGNTLSWAYVFEWPFFAAYAIYVWRKLLRDERSTNSGGAKPAAQPSDEALAEYNAYLNDVHAREAGEPKDT
jgi:hypothetical protein